MISIIKAAALGASATTTSAYLTLASGVDPLPALSLSVVAGLVAGGVGYGVVKQKADAAHRRLDRYEETNERNIARLEKKLDRLIQRGGEDDE